MLPRCLRFNPCIGVDLVDLEVRDGTSAKALNVVCWITGLHIVQPLWTNHTAKTVMKEFKIAWVKHYGWPEIMVHDQGPEFIGNQFQNPDGAAGVFTMPIDSQSPWQNGKTERAGQLFKHHLWDKDEECHIEGETEFEAAVAECCDARNRYCNRSGFSAHQRVFGSSLRLLGSLLSDDPIERQQYHQRKHLSGYLCVGCLLKCSSEQVRKATDPEWLGAELSKTLATEMFKSRQRSGQRGDTSMWR